jgi:hypothetical protein
LGNQAAVPFFSLFSREIVLFPWRALTKAQVMAGTEEKILNIFYDSYYLIGEGVLL